jgi:predicted RNA-binding Zn-ribbon protein involved in translation (DUF1610 family)
MTDFILKCNVCRAMLDEEDLFCVNCGTECPSLPHVTRQHTMQSTHNFSCENCGASMSYDAKVQNLHCPFCGSEKVHAEKDAKTLAPEAVVPLKITSAEAQVLLHKFMGNSFWRPEDLSRASVVTKMVAIYVPYWVFSANVTTHWTADSSVTPPGANADWYPVSGDHLAKYAGVLVGASGALTPLETHALCPFDLSDAIPTQEFDLEDIVFEPFRVQKKYARPQAIAGFEELERRACSTLVPGSARNLRVAIKLEELASRPMLLPVWIMAYQYRGRSYRFIINGQTGRCTGEAPHSTMKVVLVVIATILAIVFAVVLVSLCAGILSR